MATTCPNINSPEWKQIVYAVGTKDAYKIFIALGERIPDPVDIEYLTNTIQNAKFDNLEVNITDDFKHIKRADFTYKGEFIGEATLSDTGKYLDIYKIDLGDYKREGYGTIIYEKLAREAYSRGLILRSDNIRNKLSKDASNLWNSLVKKGRAEIQGDYFIYNLKNKVTSAVNKNELIKISTDSGYTKLEDGNWYMYIGEDVDLSRPYSALEINKTLGIPNKQLKKDVLSDENIKKSNELSDADKVILKKAGIKKFNFLSNQQVVNAKIKFRKFYGNNYSLIIKQVGQSTTYKISGIRNNNIDPNQMSLLSINKEQVTIAQDTRDKLINFLESKGIKLEVSNVLLDNKGMSLNGLADMVNKIVKVKEGLLDTSVLSEEVAHFAIEMLKGDPIYNRLMSLINDNYESYLGTPEEIAMYKKMYNNNVELLKKESLGKLLNKSILKKESINAQPSVIRLINNLWRKFLNLINFTSDSYYKEARKILDGVAEDILNENWNKFKSENIDSENMYSLSYMSGVNPPESFSELLASMQQSLASKAKIHESRGKRVAAAKEFEMANKLSHYLGDINFDAIAASPEGLDGTSLMGAIEFYKYAVERIRLSENRVRELVDNKDLTPQETASILRDMKSYVDSFRPILNDFASLLKSSPKFEKNDIFEIGSKKLLNGIQKLQGQIEGLDRDYLKIGIPMFANVLRQYIGKTPGVEDLDLESTLRLLEKDISFTQRWLDSMAEVDDPILRLIDKAVKLNKDRARLKALSIQKDLINALEEFEANGGKQEDIFEKDSDGKLTGYIVQERLVNEWKEDTNDFIRKLRKSFNLLEFDEPEDVLNPKKLAIYKKQIAKWFRATTEPHPNLKRILAKKKSKLSDEEYEFWYEQSVIRSSTSGRVIGYKGELMIPSLTYHNGKYKSEQYEKIQNNQNLLNFYNIIVATKKELDSLLPEKHVTPYLAPTIRKDILERFKKANTKDAVKQVIEGMKDNFVIQEDDTDFGSTVLTDENNRLVNILPVFFTNKMKDPDANLSTDIVATLSSYAAMASDYSEMSKMIDLFELGRDIIAQRLVAQSTDAGNQIRDFVSGKIVPKNKTSFALERLDDYYNMVIYNKFKAKEGTINVLGNKIDRAKLLDTLGSYVAINSLAVNVYAGLNNIVYGNAMVMMEGFAKEYINSKDLLEADKIYTTNLPYIINEIGKRNFKNKLALWIEHHNVMQDFKSDTRNLNTDRKTIVGRLLGKSPLFFLNSAGEHYMQTRLSLAIANRFKVLTDKNIETSLWNAYEVVGNELVLKNGYKTLEGEPLTEEEVAKFRLRTNFLNKRLHGIYNDEDKSAIQRFALGRLALMFRKFIKPGFNRRFENLKSNFEGETMTEGYYNTFFRLLRTDLQQMKYGIGKWYKKLKPFEQANLIRTITELSYLIGATALAAILTNIKGDDDEDWALNMIAYQANRLNSEFWFYINPEETFRILKSPAAAVNQVENLIKFLKFWDWFDTIESGRRKGDTIFEKNLTKVIPLGGTIDRLMHPDEQLMFFIK